MKRFLVLIGPGLMLAAAAVGVSHLVQATRTGSSYGLSLAWVVILIAILKYPAFRFAIDYASVTGRSLVHAYTQLGSIARAWLAVAFFVDMFIATAAVALVTAGLLISVFGLAASGPQVALGIVAVSAVLLINGKYSSAELIVKALVGLFSVLAIVATMLALPRLGSDGRDVFGMITWDRSLVAFLVAVTGWMPIPMTGSIFLSMWAREKRLSAGEDYDHPRAILDLRFGWLLTVILALCFVVLGAALLFQTPREIPASAGAFASELLGVFTAVIGDWSYPLIAAAAIAVMWSTVLALMDALPRVTHQLVGRGSYTFFLLIQVAGVAIVLLLLMGSFGTFIDLATSAGFLTAPALAWYNYRAIRLPAVSARYWPAPGLVRWHWAGFIAISLFAVAFLLQRF